MLTFLCTVSNIDFAEHVLHSFMKRCTQPDNTKFGNIENGDALTKCYALIGYIRDILYGKGKRDVAYMFIWVWYQYLPLLAKQALFSCVNIRDITKNKWVRPYGSWKDIKLFAEYVYKRTNNKNHELIEYCVSLFVREIHKISLRCEDNTKVVQNEQTQNYYSYLALKWCPRERSRSKWLFQRIAETYYVQSHSQTSIHMSKSLQFRYFRKTVQRLSQNLINYESTKSADKLEIYNMSISTQLKYFWSFINQKNNAYRNLYCSYNKLKNETIRGKKTYTQYTFPIHSLVKKAVEVTQLKKYKLNSLPRLILQNCWITLYTPYTLHSTLPIIDMSRTMEHNNNSTLYKAIATGIYLSEKVSGPFKDRVVVFSAKISVVDLSTCSDFCEKVDMVLQTHRGDLTNFVQVVTTIEEIFDDIIFAYPNSIHCIHNMTLIMISNNFGQYNVNCLKSLKYKPLLVLYNISSMKMDQKNLNEPGLLYFEEDNLNTVIRCIARKPSSKAKTKPDSISSGARKINTKTNYLHILNSPRYKYLVYDIMIQLLTVDDLKCNVAST